LNDRFENGRKVLDAHESLAFGQGNDRIIRHCADMLLKAQNA